MGGVCCSRSVPSVSRYHTLEDLTLDGYPHGPEEEGLVSLEPFIDDEGLFRYKLLEQPPYRNALFRNVLIVETTDTSGWVRACARASGPPPGADARRRSAPVDSPSS